MQKHIPNYFLFIPIFRENIGIECISYKDPKIDTCFLYSGWGWEHRRVHAMCKNSFVGFILQNEQKHFYPYNFHQIEARNTFSMTHRMPSGPCNSIKA